MIELSNLNPSVLIKRDYKKGKNIQKRPKVSPGKNTYLVKCKTMYYSGIFDEQICIQFQKRFCSMIT